jgi:hypothetical protein
MAQWSRPVAIPNQTSKTSSALALIQGRLHLIHLGASSNRLWHSTWDGTRWSDNVQIGKESEGGVALTNNGLLVYRDPHRLPDGDYGFVYSVFQGFWSRSGPLPDKMTSSHAPAAVSTFAGETVVRQVPFQGYLMSYSNYQLRAGSSTVGYNGDSGRLAELSEKVPALASSGYGWDIIYTYKGGKDLMHGNRPIPNQSTRDTPAAAWHNGVLHMVHLGASSERIWYSTFAGGQWTPNVALANHFSNKPPAMCSAPDGLHMVHKGEGSDRIWHSIYR